MKNLKKIALLVMLCFVVSITALSSVQAAEEKELAKEKVKVTETTAMVIIGPEGLVKKDFSKVIDTMVAENKELQKKLKDNKMFIGSKPQNKYREFWEEKDLMVKTVLNKAEMIEFAKYAKYDHLFIVMVEEPDFLLGSKTINLYHDNPSLSLEVLSFLITKETIVGSMKMTLAAG